MQGAKRVDKVYRDDVLFAAWKQVKANKGSSGRSAVKPSSFLAALIRFPASDFQI